MINQLCHQANLQIEHHNLTTTESAEGCWRIAGRTGVHPHAHYQPRHDLSALSDGADAGGLPGGPSATRNAYLGRVTGAGVFHSLYYQRSCYSARAAKQHRWLNPRNIAFRSDSFMTILNMINKTDLIGFCLPIYMTLSHPLCSFTPST